MTLFCKTHTSGAARRGLGAALGGAALALAAVGPVAGADPAGFDAGAAGFGTASNCQLQITNTTSGYQARFDPLSRSDYSETLSYRVRNVGAARCRGALRFVPTAGDTSLRHASGDALDFALLDARGGGRVLFNSATAQGADVGINLRAGRSVYIQPRLVVGRRQGGHSGAYRAALDLAFVGQSGLVETAFNADVGLEVRAVVQANFTGVDRTGPLGRLSVVDLGELTPGKRRALGLQIRSNTDVDAQISSVAGGRLVNALNPEEGIDYALSVGGQLLDLGGQSEIALPASTDRNGQTSPVAIQLENYTRKPAGLYGDVIRVRLSAR